MQVGVSPEWFCGTKDELTPEAAPFLASHS